MSSGSKDPYLNSEEWLGGSSPPLTQMLGRCPLGALCWESFSSVILFLSALTSLSLQ